MRSLMCRGMSFVDCKKGAIKADVQTIDRCLLSTHYYDGMYVVIIFSVNRWGIMPTMVIFDFHSIKISSRLIMFSCFIAFLEYHFETEWRIDESLIHVIIGLENSLVCRLCGSKPLYKPMAAHCQLDVFG